MDYTMSEASKFVLTAIEEERYKEGEDETDTDAEETKRAKKNDKTLLSNIINSEESFTEYMSNKFGEQ